MREATAITLPQQPVEPDLVKEIAWDIAKELAAYVERMFPEAVKAGRGSFLLSIRNHVYNDFMSWTKETDPDRIRARLSESKMARRKLRALYKAARTFTPNTPQHEQDLALSGALNGPDVCEDHNYAR
jgi:hypothetical protein